MMISYRFWPKAYTHNPINSLTDSKRHIFTAVKENYNLVRLRERLLENPNQINELVGDSNSILHIAFGAHPLRGLSLPLRPEPPHEFTEILLSHWQGYIDQNNIYSRTPLAIAAMVNYCNAVQQLLAKGANPQKALLPYLLSTVAFDDKFTVGELLLKYGAVIDDSLLFKLVKSVEEMCSIDAKSRNELYFDLERIDRYHFSRLNEKVEWLLSHGARVLSNKESPHNDLINYCLFHCMMPFGKEQSILDKTLRRLVPLLIKHCDDVSYKDKFGRSYLHWAVDKQDLESTYALIQRGLSVNEKDSCGITPYDIALLNMNRQLVQCLKPDINVDEVFNQISVDFYGNMIVKFPDYIRHSGLPELQRAQNLGVAEQRLISIYKPAYDDMNRMATPIAIALYNEDFEEAFRVISEGWNITVEEAFLKDFSIFHKEKAIGFRHAFETLFKKLGSCPTNSFFASILKILNNSSSSGITFSDEFNCSLRRMYLNGDTIEDYVFALFNAGLTPKLYYQQCNVNIKKTIQLYHDCSYSDHPDYRKDSNHKGIRKIITYINEYLIYPFPVRPSSE